MTKNGLRALLLFIIAAALCSFFYWDLAQYITLEQLQAQQQSLQTWQQQHPWQVFALYFVVYTLVTALSLPIATLMTLAGGVLFGLWFGVLVISFASTLGATLAFLVARFLLRDSLQQRFSPQLAKINQGVAKDGLFYLFSLRLIPLFPFFLINILMGLTKISTFHYYWVSQLGMLPATFIYVNAGVQLGQIRQVSDILSVPLLISLLLLAGFPWLMRYVMAYFRADKKT